MCSRCWFCVFYTLFGKGVDEIHLTSKTVSFSSVQTFYEMSLTTPSVVMYQCATALCDVVVVVVCVPYVSSL